MITGSKILLVGCGNMGGAMINGWGAKKQDLRNITVLDPALANSDKMEQLGKAGINVLEDFIQLSASYVPDVVFFAVKPTEMEDVLVQFKNAPWNNTVYVSVAAGKTLKFFEDKLGENVSVVRTIPNLPAIVGASVTVAIANQNVSDKNRHLCDTLLEGMGRVHWIDDEEQMSAVTAISGSGPAYVFYFIECLIRIGIQMGLDEEMAKLLAHEMVMGSAKLAFAMPDSVDVWRKKVTSPGGTTDAALKVLTREDGLEKLLGEAVKAAAKRSAELAAA